MLEPEVLDYILNSLSVHKELQESIIRDISRRIVKNGVSPADSLTETTVYQAEMLQRSGVVYDDIIKLVAEESNALYYDIKTAFDSAEVEIFNYDDEVLLSNGYEPEIVKNISPSMRQIWEAALRKSFTEAENLTKTIASTSQSAFISACDLAHMQIASGSFSYGQAIANATKQAARQGARVIYPSGAVANVDYAVRRATLTGINQTAGTIMSEKAKELDHDLMQTTAHYGARPEHADWQGQLVSLSGAKGYLSPSDVGYGEVTGIFGANCNHNWYLSFGYPPYTPEMLEDMKNKTVTYNGQEMSVYDAKTKQRSFERGIKASKRELVGFDEALKHLSPEDAIAVKTQFQNSSVKLKRQEARLKDFCKQTGLKRDTFREQVFSVETEDAIKSWTKSVSQKAVMSAQKHHTAWLKSIGAENGPKTLAKYYKIKYNNTREYQLLDGYKNAVKQGDISPLVGFDLYKDVAKQLDKELVGLTTIDGVVIKDYATHFIDRVIGQTSTPRKGMRQGVPISVFKETLTAQATRITPDYIVSMGKGDDIRRSYLGTECKISISVTDQKLIQTNPS